MSDSFSVTELTTRIRQTLDSDPMLHDVWVVGEVSNFTRASSGHWYFSMKDNAAQLKCVMFRRSADQQHTIPQNGDQISVHGSISVYEARGEYQLYADAVQAVGLGDLYRQFELVKAKLQDEGFFDEARKRPIPLFPYQIGVVTSPTAAAFQDIQNVLRRRFPLAEVILSPTLVQGNDAPPQIVHAIERLNQQTNVDVILVCRGGGSIEDLWAFNDEAVARAIAASRIPTVSGVGHEIDFTIADFVADLRAPTPSAAAEVATPNLEDLGMALERLAVTMQSALQETLSTRKNDLALALRGLDRSSPAQAIRTMRQRVDDQNERMVRQQGRYLALLKERLASRNAALNAANPDAILARGYAIVTRTEDGTVVRSEKDANPGTGVTIRLKEGELKARVEDKDSHEQYTRTLF